MNATIATDVTLSDESNRTLDDYVDVEEIIETLDEDEETCDRCSTTLSDAHDKPAGYTVVTTGGEELCPDCADARSGEEIGFVSVGADD